MRLLFAALVPLGILVLQQGDVSHAAQGMRLWDGENYTYPSILVESYEEDLEERGFNDVASAACIYLGLWIFYEHAVYNSYSTGAVVAMWGEEICSPLPQEIDNKVSSVRYSGPPVDHREDSIQLYEKEWFADQEYYHLFDQTSTEARAKSAIVTGVTPWTLYELPLYQGEGACVFPGDDRNPGLYPSLAEVNATWPIIYSMRKGCFSDVKLMPLTLSPGQTLYSGDFL